MRYSASYEFRWYITQYWEYLCSGDFEAQGDVAKSRKKIPTITSRPKTPTRNQRQINEAGTQNTRFIFHAQRRISTSPTSMPFISPIFTGQSTGQDWYRLAQFKRLSIWWWSQRDHGERFYWSFIPEMFSVQFFFLLRQKSMFWHFPSW
jgi:hypothetical protein